MIRRAGTGDIVIGLMLLVALAMAFDLSVWLRGGFGWRWPYQLVPLIELLPLIAVTAVYLAGVWLILRRTGRAAPLIVWAIAGSVAIVLAGVYARDENVIYELFARTASLLSTGQQWAAAHVDWSGGAWRNWTEVMERLGGHMTNVPPGAPLIYAVLSDLLDRVPAISIPIRDALIAFQCNNFDLLSYTPGEMASSLLGMLMPLWAALAVIPLYSVGRRLIGTDARYAVIWWPLVPAVIGFAESWSTVYPLIALLVFLLLLIGLERERGYVPLFASGLLFGIGLFINFALIPLLILLGLYTLGLTLLVQKRGWLRAIVAGAIFGVGMVLPWLIYWLLGGQTFVALLTTSLDFHLDIDRPYWFWVGMHLWDWFLWTGVGFAALGIVFLARWRRERQISRFAVLSGALAATMLILIISGTARGETGRVWLFFSPFLLIVGAGAMRDLRVPRFGWLTIAQAVYMIALVASLNAMSTDLLPPPSPPQVSAASPVDATFSADQQALFRLTAWGATVDGDAVDLRLNWLSLSPASIPYWFGAVLVSPDGQTIGSPAWQPGAGDESALYPTTCWSAQAQVGDEVKLALPADAAPGDWWVSLAAYSGDESGTRLEVTQPGHAPDQQVGLGPIHVGS